MNKEKEYKWTNDDQQTFNRNIVKRIQELEDKRPSKVDDQIDIKLMKQEEFNANVVKRLEDFGEWRHELEDFKEISIKRFDQGIENRTKAFSRIEALESFKYDTNIKLERHDDILVVHSNQNDTQRKNHKQLIKVFDEKVIPLIEGTHGKEE